MAPHDGNVTMSLGKVDPWNIKGVSDANVPMSHVGKADSLNMGDNAVLFVACLVALTFIIVALVNGLVWYFNRRYTRPHQIEETTDFFYHEKCVFRQLIFKTLIVAEILSLFADGWLYWGEGHEHKSLVFVLRIVSVITAVAVAVLSGFLVWVFDWHNKKKVGLDLFFVVIHVVDTSFTAIWHCLLKEEVPFWIDPTSSVVLLISILLHVWAITKVFRIVPPETARERCTCLTFVASKAKLIGVCSVKKQD